MTYIMRNDHLPLRVRQAVERQLRRVPLVEQALGLRNRLARGGHVDHLPAPTPQLRDVRRGLVEHGVASAPLPALGLPLDGLLAAVEPLVAALAARRAGPATRELMAPDADVVRTLEPMRFGLAPPLLDLAECYLGLPVNYLGVNLKREVANGVHGGTRMWHRDPEDERMLKLIVYLSDVDDGCGPFEAVTAARSAEASRAIGYRWGTVRPDEDVARVVPPADRRRITGPRLTAVFADPARCLHRATPPERRDRYSMTFSYVSRHAYFCFEESLALQRRFLARWEHALDARERAALAPLR